MTKAGNEILYAAGVGARQNRAHTISGIVLATIQRAPKRRWKPSNTAEPSPLKNKPPPDRSARGFRFGGPKRDRTADLHNAIVALSQLSYGPECRVTAGWRDNAISLGAVERAGT